MESTPLATTNTVAQRLWHIVRAVFYMLRKGISRRKLMLDLHLLLKRGKLAGKAIGNLLLHHHHHPAAAITHDLHFSNCSCRSYHPDALFYDPKGIQLSCSNTPTYAYYYPAATAKRRNGSSRRRYREDSYDAAVVAKAIEMFENESSDAESVASSGLLTPSPMLGMMRRTPTGRQLRITDSPFMITEELDGVDVGRIDKEAEEFISRFYEQLRRQQFAAAAATPECVVRGRKPVAGRA